MTVGADARHIERVASRVAADLAQASGATAPPTYIRRILRGFTMVWQVVTRIPITTDSLRVN